MPKRSNEFQRLVTTLYEAVAPVGATLKESAMLPDRSGGALREVDILLEHEVAGHRVRIAIECRDHARLQTIEWIDALSGKYRDAQVDKVIAISRTGFRRNAKEKAASLGIETLTAAEATSVDWSSQLVKPWKILTHRHMILLTSVAGTDGEKILYSEVDPDTYTVTHRDEISALTHPALVDFFLKTQARETEISLNAKIAGKWEEFIETKPRLYCEVHFSPGPDAHIEVGGKAIPFAKLVFGIGTTFNVAEYVPDAIVLNEHVSQSFSHGSDGVAVEVRWVTNTNGEIVRLVVEPERPQRRRPSRLGGA